MPYPVIQRCLLTLLFTMLWCLGTQAQLAQITHFSGPATYGSRTVTVTPSSSGTSSISVPCMGMPMQYHAGLGGPGTYTYTISAPVYKLRIEAHGLNAGPLGGGEYLEISINGSVYPLTAADMVSYSHCGSTGAGLSYLLSGRLYGPLGTFSWSHHNAGIIEITNCTGINSFAVYCDGVGNGAAYHVFVDTIVPPVCIVASNNGPVCAGDTIKLFATGTGTGTYAWTGPAGFTSTLQNPVIPGATPANAGTYTVVYTTSTGTATATTTVMVNTAGLGLTASSSAPACSGSTLFLTASPSIPGATYSWTGPSGYSSSMQNPAIPGCTTSNSGMYTVIASLGGCADTATVNVIVMPAPSVTATNNGPICVGNSLELSATATTGATLLWSGPTGFTSTSGTPSISPAGTANSGVYTVVATLGPCKDTAYTSVSVMDKPDITASANTPLCELDTLKLICSTSTTVLAFTWTGPGGFSSSLQNPVRNGITVAGAGMYTIIAGFESCADTANVLVTVYPVPQVTASGNQPCEGGQLNLSASPANTGTTFKWIGPNGFSSMLRDPVIPNISVNKAGTYTVTATQNGCSKTDTVLIGVTSVAQYLRDTTVCLEEQPVIVLWANVPAGAMTVWSTGQTAPSIKVKDTGVYWVRVSAGGCVGRDTVQISGEVCDCDIAIPNSFTPNADGRNDYFRPIIPEGCLVTDYEFAIYNRWGERVFFSRDPTAKWDGKYKGVDSELCVFMYYLKYKAGSSNTAKFLKGDVTLIR